jgi:Uma2 family endonuclease
MAVTTSGLPVHAIDSDTYDRIVEAGLLDGQRVELIDGVITDMSPQSPQHAAAVRVLAIYLQSLISQLQIQAPLRVAAPNTLPEPDVAIVTSPPLATAHPAGALFVAEVASTSRELDLHRKAELYAESEVPVYWVIDTSARTVHVHTDPAAGRYGSVDVYETGTAVPPPLPDLPALNVDDLFPGG